MEHVTDELRERDRMLHRRLERLALAKRSPSETLTTRDLGFVLHDVLADGFRKSREVRARNEQYWARLGLELDGALGQRDFDREVFLLGAYATAAGLELALADAERVAVFEEFRRAAGGVLRVRRSQPGRWLIDIAVKRYRAQEPPGGGSFLHVANVFVENCIERAAAPDAVIARTGPLGEVALEAFYDAAAGTIAAASGWTVVS